MKKGGITLSLTKIVVPARRPEILSRERLLARLDELLEQKLILVTAPAGYGKTSLLIDLAGQTEMPVCWLSLDGLDRDPQRFISYFISAISQRFPRFGSQSNSALTGLTALDQGLENLIITLVNEIYEVISEHFVIVVDDYQFVDSIPEIRDFVSRFIQLASENCHLILASRRLPALPDMALLVARQQVGGFDLQELAFQPGEIRALFERNHQIHLTDSDLEELVLHTEGWITGLNLSRPRQAAGVPDLNRSARSIEVGLPDYFEKQVLDDQTPEMREFLLRTSFFDEFDATLCGVVLGTLAPGESHNWKRLVDTVRQNNLFVLPVGPGGKWLRYHHLIQEFLQARFKDENPETAEAILIYLVQYYEQQGEWEKAHHVYEQLGDYAGMAGLVARAGTILIRDDRIITLGSWLEELPDSIVQESPVLISLKGTVALLRGRVRYGLTLLDQAVKSTQAEGETQNLVTTLVRRSLAHRLLGDYAESIADADEAIRLSIHRQQAVFKQARADALRMKGLCLFRLGQVKQSAELLESSIALSNQQNMVNNIPSLQTELGMVRRAMGDYTSAKDLYEKALEIWKRLGNLTLQANLLNSLGVLYHAQGEYEQAAVAFEQGLDCARRSGYLRTEALLLASLGDLYMELSEYEIARHAYEKAEDIARQTTDRFLLTYSLLAQAGIARATGSYDRARLLLDEVRSPVRESNSTYEQGLFELETGRLELATGDPERAVQHLQNSVKLFTLGSLALESGWSRLWLAAASNQVGDLATMSAQIKETARLDGNTAHSLGMVAFQVRDWLDGKIEDGESRAALEQLLGRARQIQSRLPALRKRLRRLTSTVPMPPPHLDIRAFGKAQVRINGKPVTHAQWQAQSVTELFFYFLYAEEPVTKEQVGADLWPEVTTEGLKLRFKNNLYRLRRALGPEVILWEGEFYRFNRDLDFEYDVDAFEAHMTKARSANGLHERIQHYREAINLVRGPYLADLSSMWCIPEQTRLADEHVHAMLSLTKLLIQIEEYDEALQICRRALASDPCLEEAHCFAMRIYDRRGDQPAVIRQYQACRSALRTGLGMAPSPETEVLYQRLVA